MVCHRHVYFHLHQQIRSVLSFTCVQVSHFLGNLVYTNLFKDDNAQAYITCISNGTHCHNGVRGNDRTAVLLPSPRKGRALVQCLCVFGVMHPWTESPILEADLCHSAVEAVLMLETSPPPPSQFPTLVLVPKTCGLQFYNPELYCNYSCVLRHNTKISWLNLHVFWFVLLVHAGMYRLTSHSMSGIKIRNFVRRRDNPFVKHHSLCLSFVWNIFVVWNFLQRNKKLSWICTRKCQAITLQLYVTERKHFEQKLDLSIRYLSFSERNELLVDNFFQTCTFERQVLNNVRTFNLS